MKYAKQLTQKQIDARDIDYRFNWRVAKVLAVLVVVGTIVAWLMGWI